METRSSNPISSIEGHFTGEIKVDEAVVRGRGRIVFWYCLRRGIELVCKGPRSS